MANDSNSSGGRRQGSVWGHNPAGRKRYWKKFIARQMRRQDKGIERNIDRQAKKYR